MSRNIASLLLFFATLPVASSSASAVTIPTVPVGDAGNANDTTGFGAVAYAYRIGTYEVTNSQYAEFLNAKAASDPLALYSTDMGSQDRGGITRSGSPGTFSYHVKANMGDKPVNFVSWYDAARFANWLHNGQGAGDTELGAYTLLGGTAIPTNGLTLARNAGATWFLASEDEWYKAAYYDPTLPYESGNYWVYPTRSNSAPVFANANSVGDVSNPGPNVANYRGQADWNNLRGNVTTVGSAGLSSESFYGTSDQGGNVWEWNEALVTDLFRGLRGGAWSVGGGLRGEDRNFGFPTDEFNFTGFRVATVPEPSSFMLACMAMVSVSALRAVAKPAANLVSARRRESLLRCGSPQLRPLPQRAILRAPCQLAHEALCSLHCAAA